MKIPGRKDGYIAPCLYFKHGRYWHVKRGKWHDFGTDLHEALKRYADANRSGRGGMEKLLDEWLEQSDIKPSTRAHYRSAINSKIKPAFVEFSPAEVEAPDVAAFLYHHRAHPNMANRMRTILKGAFDLAVRQGIARSNPVISTVRNTEKKRDRYLTDEEFTSIRNQADDTLQLIMDAAYLTGQRIGDVLKIRISDIRPAGIYIKQQKTGKELLVEISPELRAVIDDAKGRGNVRSMYLFSQRTGKKWSYKAIYERWQAAALAAGVKDARPHDIRAKAITEATKQGLDAQKLAGHTSPAMTERYIRDREIDVAKPPTFRQK